MHGMHFAFGLGSTLGPMVASPFLRHKDQEDTEYFGITTLFPIVGSIACLCGLSFLMKGFYDTITLAKEPQEVSLNSSELASHRILMAVVCHECISDNK